MNHHFTPKSLFTACLLATGISALALTPINTSKASATSHAASQEVPSIQVTGTGKSSIAPDMAIINLGVVREAQTAREALDANNGAMARVLSELKAFSIEDKDLQTSNFNIQPRYFYPPRKNNGEQKPPRITGYTVSNNLTVRIRKLEDLGAVLDKVVTLGVNSGGGVQFSNADPKAVIMEARENAMRNAIEKAATLTGVAGVKLGKVLNIAETSRAPRPAKLAHARAAFSESADAAVPVATGENTYQVHVNVKWALDQ